MNIHGYKLEHEDYYVPSGMFHKKVDHIDSKESEGVCMSHLYDLVDYTDKIATVSIEAIPEINLEDGSKFNFKNDISEKEMLKQKAENENRENVLYKPKSQ